MLVPRYWHRGFPAISTKGNYTDDVDSIPTQQMLEFFYRQYHALFTYERREEVPEEGLPVKPMGSQDKSVSS